MELRHGSLQSSQKSRLTALPALPRACLRHHIGGQAAEAGRHCCPCLPARPPGGTATGTTRDSRRGTATAATGLHGVSRVVFLFGGDCGGLLPVLAGLAPAPVCRRNSKWWCSATPTATPPVGVNGRTGPG